MRFYCTILVERETQKPILVGKAGAMIKAIGTAARKELEKFFDARVFLDLHVKVREGWREDERMLDSLGLPSKKRSLSASECAAVFCAYLASAAKIARIAMAPQRRIDVVLDSVKRLLRIGATANLLNLLQKQHPADLAQVFGSLLDTERQAVFSILVERNGRLAMETVSEMGPEEGAKLLTGRSAEEIAKLLQEIPSDDAAALIDYLPEELSAEVLELMRRRESGQVESLLEYGEQTAGRIMNPQVFALSEDLTVGEAITALQSSRDVEMVFYLYVVDARRHLVGVTSLRRLLLVSPETPLKRIMTPEVTSVRVDTDQEEVARQVASYNLLAVPVVDEENKLVGIVTVDDVIDVIKDEAAEDLLRLAGVSGDERIATPASEAIRKRLPWLGVNLGDGVPRRLGGLAVRGHDSAGHGAGGVHADRRGHGRQRRAPRR